MLLSPEMRRNNAGNSILRNEIASGDQGMPSSIRGKNSHAPDRSARNDPNDLVLSETNEN
jgi:hypothetical protein